MVVTKEKGWLVILMAMFLALALWAHGYIFWKGGISAEALKIHAYTAPVSALFTLFAFGIYRSLKRRLVISEAGLLVEDFSQIEFPWQVIHSASIQSQFMSRIGTIHWLVLYTKKDGAYASRIARHLNKLVDLNGIPVCNLAIYKGDPEAIVREINRRAGGR